MGKHSNIVGNLATFKYPEHLKIFDLLFVDYLVLLKRKSRWTVRNAIHLEKFQKWSQGWWVKLRFCWSIASATVLEWIHYQVHSPGVPPTSIVARRFVLHFCFAQFDRVTCKYIGLQLATAFVIRHRQLHRNMRPKRFLGLHSYTPTDQK